ncbi:TPA: Fanconi anemia group J protein [Trebouxia sp. C0006]
MPLVRLLLCSPAGKTLALLCATLAWQQQQAHLAPQQPDAPAPRVFWAARTHAQIDHAVHEVRRTSYRPMMTILASRERFCLHPDIATAPNKTEACEGATMVGHMDCSYLENAEASWYPQGPEHLPAYKPGGRLETFDIEELVAEGRAGHVCPYHASRDVLNEGAALVFVTYSQLLDPPVRSANGLDDLLQGAVLVFDEAHNIAAECRAAATLQMSTDDLQALALDLGGMQGSLNKMAPASRQWRQAADWARELAHLVDTMQTWLARQLSSTSLPFQKEQGMSNSRAAIEVWEGTGPDAYTAVVHHLNLSIHRVETLQGRLKAMRRGLIEGGFESTAVKSGAINQLEALLSKLLFVLQTRGLGYRCILTRHSTAGKARRGPPGALPHAKGPDSKGKSQGVPIEGSFSFLCLHAAVALTPLLPKAHSLLLTSGTLSPVAPLVAELGLGTKPKRQVSSNASPKNREVADPAKGLGLAPEPWDHMTEAADASSSKICQADVSDELKGKSEQLIRRHPVQSGSLTGTDAQVDEQAVDLEPSSVQQSAVQQGQQKPVLYSGTASQLGSLQHDAQQSHCCQPAKQEVAPLQSAGSRRLESNSCTHQLQPLQSSACPQLQMDPQSELHSSTAQNAGNGVQPAPVRSQYASLHQGVELVSAPHHHTLPTRLLPLSISMAPGADGRLVKLDSAYERRQDAGYLDALGNAMLATCRAIPNGVLCFFPSWGLLNAARDQWLVTGLWQELSACKEVITEPTNVSGEVFDEAIKSYRQAAAKGQGAVLLAVMRGRSSEGVDFLDDCARAVVVVGIPYPPLYETSVRLKRVFNHDHEALLGSGDDWYAAEAFRAVNQAIGRLIRHQKDYGCVLLLDHRYNVLKFRQLTPAWLQPLLRSTAMADAPALLQNFFAGRC